MTIETWSTREKAEHAQRLLNDPLLADLLNAREREIYSDWSNTDDLEKREALWQQCQAIRWLAQSLASLESAYTLEQNKAQNDDD